MLVVMALNLFLLVVLAGVIVLTAVLGGWAVVFWLVIIGLIGLAARGRSHRLSWIVGADVERCQRALEPLCILAGLPEPELAVIEDEVPLSWTLAPWGRKPRIHFTTGMLRAASEAELSAVLAHELSHIANRDAALMTVLAGVPTPLLRGATRLRGRSWWRGYFTGAYYALPALLPLATARLFSRYRELAADRGAAVLTGSPASVQAALLHFSGTLKGIPSKDLREAATGDLFHFLPAHPQEGAGARRIWATHPRLSKRLEQLERLEQELQDA
jgi:heat shock protein HtpX